MWAHAGSLKAAFVKVKRTYEVKNDRCFLPHFISKLKGYIKTLIYTLFLQKYLIYILVIMGYVAKMPQYGATSNLRQAFFVMNC